LLAECLTKTILLNNFYPLNYIKIILFLSLSLFACKVNKTSTNSNEAIGKEDNLLLNTPNFSLDYNKNPTTNTLNIDSGEITLPHSMSKGNCIEPLTEITFKNALSLIEKVNNSVGKLALAKQIIENNCLTTFQIKRIGDFFTSELYKLQIFEYGYRNCYDTNNYFILEKEFVLEVNQKKFKTIIE